MSARRLALLAVLWTAASPLAAAQSAESLFHHAYFLEHERGHLEDALELYEQVARTADAGPALQSEAAGRAAGLREELASVDLARLLPAGAILYVELREPGEQLAELLRELGLLGRAEDAARTGALAVSPELLQGLLGIRGAAAALTGVPGTSGPPEGVLVLDPGDMDILRGLIETLVPFRGRPGEPLEGRPTWILDGEVQVVLTERLVVASRDREELAGVLRRLRGEAADSLAADPALQEFLAPRGSDLFFACLNAAPVRPLLAALVEHQTAADPGLAMVPEVLDLASLRAVVARGGVVSDGLALDVGLHLESDHRNLAFNFLRAAALDPAVLDFVPAGAAAFVSGALNERGPALAALHENAAGEEVVTAADLGRELFANLAGLALFVLPSQGMLPEAALVLTSNDPARSRAVLELALGLARLASGGKGLEAEEAEIAGAEALVFRLPFGISLHLVTHENALLLSASESAIERALRARADGESVRRDPAFASEVGAVGAGTTLAVVAHVGRCLATARPYLPQREWSELEPFVPAFEKTVVALRTEHGDARMGLSLALHGLPRIDGIVGLRLAQARERRMAGASGAAPAAPGLRAAEQALDVGAVRERFDLLALEQRDGAAARQHVHAALPRLGEDVRGLNNLAWDLLTEERYGGLFDDLALEVATLANERTGHSVWQYLDTLALAKFRTGSVREAVELEQAALERADEAQRAELEQNLRRFRDALGGVVSDSTPR